MSWYAEISIDIYDDDKHTTGVGPFREYDKAVAEAARLQERLTTGKAKRALDELHGVGEYNVTVIALRLRTVAQAYREIVENT